MSIIRWGFKHSVLQHCCFVALLLCFTVFLNSPLAKGGWGVVDAHAFKLPDTGQTKCYNSKEISPFGIVKRAFQNTEQIVSKVL